jgi:hypothetical protein
MSVKSYQIVPYEAEILTYTVQWIHAETVTEIQLEGIYTYLPGQVSRDQVLEWAELFIRNNFWVMPHRLPELIDWF